VKRWRIAIVCWGCVLGLERSAPAQQTPGAEEPRRRTDRNRIGDRPRETAPPAKEPEGAPPPEAQPPPGTSPDFEPLDGRWFIEPPPYEVNSPRDPLNPYTQNILKGDYPIFGEDLFLNLTATDKLLIEGRRVPVGTGITGPERGKDEFFGDFEQFQVINNAVLQADLFKGQQAFKPVDWRLKAALVYNTNYVRVEETGAVNINVQRDTDRLTDYLALQEAIAEIHLFDLNDRYDFVSTEIGILSFNSDFRGFVFNDTNLGWRIFGNADANKWQYNLAFFNQLEKDTNSELNRFQDRGQYVLIANVYRQDFLFLGYTASFSVHYNHDDGELYFNRNGFLTRPKPAGLAKPHDLDAVYLGWAGEGHIGPVNVSHAFYQVFGREEDNEFAARSTEINAQLAAIELSYDIDWLRPRIFTLYQSGDEDTRDKDAEGFDGILEAPAFAGGEASFWNRQEIRLLGVSFTQRLSPYVDLSTSKLEGQSNFVNPGLLLAGAAIDAELTPKWRAVFGGSYLRLVQTEAVETFLELESVDEDLGAELFLATQYRPLLTNNLIFNVGFSPFFPGAAFEKVFETSEVQFSGFLDTIISW